MMNRIHKSLLSMITAGALAGLSAAFAGFPGVHSIDWEWQSELSNRYVTEGIDNDPDSSGFWFNTLTADYQDFTFGAWYGQSLRGSAYNEINLFAEYGFSLGEVELFAGVTWLTFPAPDESSTWELYVGFEYEAHPLLTLFGETYYDVDEVRGGFVELGVASVLPTDGIDERLTLTPYGLWGLDYGYVSGPRRLKGNNLQFGLQAAFAIDANWDLFGSLNHSFRLGNLRAEDEGDVTWVSAGFALRF